ncbi:acyltransferase family protein [Devosia sp. 2618]|uniref:acyltransferase family protein n=1 Tax=Devosia sp. 2618 TaxID=3156454 RepID=UPI00339AA76D
MQKSTYRPDIDGLRAIAVLAVLAYHLGFSFIPGGFVGVDVFFVISGYLITSIIVREMAQGEFSFLGFYARRFRRILPALLVVIPTSLGAGWVLLLPTYYSNLSESATAATFGLSNIFFWLNTDYFDQAADQLPLLHTWSLAVEEQFYIVWPIALVILAGLSRTHLTKTATIALGAVIVVSLVWSEVMVRQQSSQPFFLTHLRAWELAIGAIIALAPAVKRRWLAFVMDALGITLIGYAVFRLSAASPFPGASALWPCVGAALIVAQKDRASPIAWLLGTRLMVWVGLISYSLYLWHWPIIVFYRYYIGGDAFSTHEKIALGAASVVVAALSWKFVELPFRRPTSVNSAMTIYFGLGGMLGAAVLAGGIVWQGGLYQRFSPEVQVAARYLDYPIPGDPLGRRCFITSGIANADAFDPDCVSVLDGGYNVLVIGDSHAMHYASGLFETFPDVNFSQIYASGCRPVIGTRGSGYCVDLMGRAFEEIIPAHQFDEIVVSARWASGAGVPASLQRTIEWLRTKSQTVVIIGQNLEYSAALPELLVADAVSRRSVPDMEERRSSAVEVNAELRALSDRTGALFFDPLASVCEDGACKHQTPDGAPMLYDSNHLTTDGAAYVLRDFRAQGLFRVPA